MVETTTEEALVVLQEFLGGWFILIAFLFAFGAFNFMFVWVKGIQYLDEEFSPHKKYDDTWTYSAGSRFFDYSWAYLRGKIKTEKVGMRLWMWFNSATNVIMVFLLLYTIFFDLYKWIISF
jgi:hypothetical protein